jgi:hypothetical protein
MYLKDEEREGFSDIIHVVKNREYSFKKWDLEDMATDSLKVSIEAPLESVFYHQICKSWD